MSGGLELTVESRGSAGGTVAVVTVEGEIDLGNAEEFETALRSPDCESAERIVIDLTRVPFMDSSGLRVLLMAATEAEHDLAVVLPQESPVLRLLELAEVTDRLEIHAGAQEAVEGVAAEPADRG